ncbi:MAG: ABC transporter ATP-binding protein [Roseburia sp.]|nr:ABC transporter ATP-binding protein [Anaeroplasma bactoclasticum]MCM1197239.1 ABC transporter ATP-binding protein [Roseburia sp.]MCM1556225.1 ABC transporter ATP-binding protein [Anaeroplasma bactoclasticum]
MKIEFCDIEKYYQENCVFNQLNLVLEDNLVKIEGGNGSGKSTLLKILSASTSFKGNILINDLKQTKSSLQKNVILAHQDIFLLENLTVLQNIKALGLKKNTPYIEKLISNILTVPVKELSGGQKKLVELTLAFTIEPSILLLDEFSNFLDQENLDQIKACIIEYSKSHMVIYVDHNEDLGGTVLNLDSYELSIHKENAEVEFKRRTFKPSLFFFVSQFKLLSIASFFVYFLLFTSILFALTIRNANSYEVAYGYYEKNHLHYIELKNDVEDKSLSMYYGIELSIQEKMELNPFYYVTYYKHFDFSLKEEANPLDGYKNCYVFENNADCLSKTFTFKNEKYYVQGIIDYPIEQDLVNKSYQTFLIEGDTLEETSFRMAYLNDEKLQEYFSEKKVYIENTGLLSTIYNNINENLFTTIIIVLSALSIVFICFNTIIQVRNEKEKLIFLKQYGNSNIELGISKILGDLVKYLFLGIGGYFLVAYLVTQYEKRVIFPWSSILHPSIWMILTTILLFLFISNLLYLIYIQRKLNK